MNIFLIILNINKINLIELIDFKYIIFLNQNNTINNN